MGNTIGPDGCVSAPYKPGGYLCLNHLYFGTADIHRPEGPFIKFKPENMLPTAIILCGVSGHQKLKWAEDNMTSTGRFKPDDFRSYVVISKEKLRVLKTYSAAHDEFFSTVIEQQLKNAVLQNKNVIIDLDTTNSSQLHILTSWLKHIYSIRIQFFDRSTYSLYKEYFSTWIRTGYRIPLTMFRERIRNYKNINRELFKKYNY